MKITIEVTDDAHIILRVNGNVITKMTKAEWSEVLAHPVGEGAPPAGVVWGSVIG